MTVMGTDSVTGSSLFAEQLPARMPEQALASVAVLGLGYVGLPTSIGLADQGMQVIGVDVSERRLQDVREGSVDLAGPDRERTRS
jgi:UDP-N-acetyl-D-mannosaminuronate dehydrogenase